jgi:cytochrome c oxidase subunit 2
MNLLICQSFHPQYDFLDSGSYIMDGIISLNDHILFYEILILTIVIWTLLLTLIKSNNFILKDLYHGSVLEIVWTLIPGIILILIALPSFRLLYLMDDFLDTTLSIKVIGNQWYWSYNYNDIQFDSYMNQDLYKGSFRLLDTDEYLILPSNTPIRLLITSSDVIHSWAIPSLGIKMDACPGRLNQIGVEIYRSGTYYGMCSEICGVSHAFMPITLKVI